MTDNMTPTLQAREFMDRSAWYVVVAWPSGEEEQIDGFGSEAEVNEWIAKKSRAWLARRISKPA